MSDELGDMIRIDDLHAPRLDPGQQAALDYVASLDLDLAEERLLDEARGRAQCDDFGDLGFLARLRAMIDAVEADTGLGPLGRLAIRQRVLRLLTSRLLVEVRYSNRGEAFGNRPDVTGVWASMIPVFDQFNGLQYRGRGGDGEVNGSGVNDELVAPGAAVVVRVRVVGRG